MFEWRSATPFDEVGSLIARYTDTGTTKARKLTCPINKLENRDFQTPRSNVVALRRLRRHPLHTTTVTSASLTPIHQPRKLTLFCWILGISDRSFSVDVEENITVDHLKLAIVKRNPVSFAGVDAYELDLWKVSAFLPFSTFADNFPTRHPFRLTGNSRTRLANNSFLKVMCYWRETDCRKIFHHLVPLRRRFKLWYDIRVLVSHL